MRAAAKRSLERRQFLIGLGAGAGAAATSTLVIEAKADTESKAEKRKPRYKESDHVKAYYRVNRYPS